MEPGEIQSIPLRDFTEEVISIRNARKKYFSVVLDGLNMTVPKGAIYGLLGPSGCGKTTILNCITGRTELDSGTIDVKVSKLEQLGYMPQALCLLSGLTIMENFYFHGYLYYMNNARIKYRGANLILFLDLPSKNTLISDLSGGEQRRVSLATALFHDPQLLILDEPTVGLDPILSHSIWERLKFMSKNGTTILITTHYVQDAYSSDIVGLMRDGVLVAEHKPDELLGKFNSNNLEDVFLQLSFKQSKIKPLGEDREPKDKNKKPFKVHFENDHKLLTSAKFKGLVYKTLTLLKRSYLIQLTVIILPFLNTFLFNAAIGRTPKGLFMAVVNDEVPLEDCRDVSKYNTCLLNENGTVFLSCLFLDIMKNKSYNFIEYDHLSKAVEGVKKNEIWAMLHFKKNFTAAMTSRFNEDLTTDENIEYMISNSIESRLDMSNQYIGSFITYDLTRSMTSFLEQIMQICDLNPKLGSLPIRFEEPIYGHVDENFITYSSAALICVYCFVLPSIWSCTQMFLDKTDGILERTFVAGSSMFDVCTSIFAVQLVTHVIQTAVSMYVMYVMFENPMRGSLLVVCILMLLTGTAGIFYGMILGLLFDSITMLGAASTGTIITLTLVTGLIWPTEGAHYLIRILRWFLPLTWTVDATRALSLKAFPIYHPVIVNGFLAVIFLNVTSAVFIYFVPMLKKTIIFKKM